MVVVAILAVIALLGPRPVVESGWVEPQLGPDLDAYLTESERDVPALRPGDAKSVVWRDPDTRERTEVSIVYLHGFSADRHEVEPLITDLARDLQANVYFTRLRGHGRDGVGMLEPSAADWLVDTAEAIAIGGRIGEKVVVVATSTGGTLALWAAAQEQVRGFNGTNKTWFCGAWMKHGFHEDGLSSAIDVVRGMRDQSRVAMAAE